MPDIKSGTIQITGLSELEKNLEQFPDRLAKNILSGAIRAGAVVIQKEARSRALQSAKQHNRYQNGMAVGVVMPGNLKKNVKVRLAPRKSRERPIEYWIYVGKKAFYWKFLEFGTRKMSAKPFMRPAFETMRRAALERIKEYLAARIDKEASKRGTE